jgi:multiple sugar transport system substrate-binding protein
MMWHWQASLNAKPRNKKAAFLFLLWATSKPTSRRDWRRHAFSAWSSEGLRRHSASRPLKRPQPTCNLQHAGVALAKAILFHPQSSAVLDAFMIGVHEVVSGKKPAQDAMTAAAEKANAAIRGQSSHSKNYHEASSRAAGRSPQEMAVWHTMACPAMARLDCRGRSLR